MNLEIMAITLDAAGKIILGITVLAVHWHVLKEHKIDRDVLRQMKKEKVIGIFGIVLLISGYLLEVFIKI